MQVDEKTRLRLEKNRRSAACSRKKKQQEESALKQENQHLKKENSRLRQELSWYRDRFQALSPQHAGPAAASPEGFAAGGSPADVVP